MKSSFLQLAVLFLTFFQFGFSFKNTNHIQKKGEFAGQRLKNGGTSLSMGADLHKKTEIFDPLMLSAKKPKPVNLGLGAIAAALPFIINIEEAAAKGGELGIWEGRTFALIHPFTMIGLFLGTFYAGYTGLQWRSVRTVGEDISQLKAQLPKLVTRSVQSPIAPLIAEIKAELATESDNGKLKQDLDALEGAKELDAKIAQLTEKRKELIKGDFRDKHWTFSSFLLAAGVAIAIEGPVNTFCRTGKLFPGPHLYAGAAVTVIWAVAASLVPAMQKGNEAARSAHIALNTINLALFSWQVLTGFEILQKVFQFTKWP